jgi:site-specific DNA recombinase
MTMQAGVYARISDDRRGGAGLGVQRQVEDCRTLAERLGWSVAGVYVDNDVSAYSGKPRKDYQRLLADIRAGHITGVLAWHTDRLHRSPVELEEYITVCELHAAITHTVQAGPLDLSTPSGRMIARQLGAVARFESEHKGERVRAARQHAAMAGRWQGGCRPFGFEADGITIRPAEASAIARTTEAIVSGASLRSVVRDLNVEGHRTAWDREWNSQAVRAMLCRPRNAGLTRYGDETFPAVWPAIVPEATWRAAVSILGNPARRTSMGNRVKWLGSGLYLCGVCGKPDLRVSTAGGKRLPAYRCKARDNTRQTGHVTRAAMPLDAYVERLVVARLQCPDAAELFAEPADPDLDANALHIETAAIGQRLDDLSTAFADGAITVSQLRAGTDKLRARLAEIEDTLASATAVNPLIGLAGQSDIAEIWYGTTPDRSDGLDLGRRRAVLTKLITITVLPTSRGRRPDGTYFDPTGIRITWKTS